MTPARWAADARSRIGTSAAYGFAARPALQALEAELAPDELAAARDAAAEANLADLVEQALTAVAAETSAASL